METIEKKGTWTLDKMHAKVGFAISHLMISEVEGQFKDFDITVKNAQADLSGAQIEFSAKVGSIDTGNQMRDDHMKKDDFFHAEKHPTINFKSTSFTKTGENTFKLTGDLTIMGVTKNVSLNAKGGTAIHPRTQQKMAGFKVTGTVNRAEFGIAPGMPSAALGHDVDVVANVEFVME